MLIGLFAENLAQFLEIELGGVAHAALAPAEKPFQPAQLAENLTGITQAHALGALKGKLIHQLLELLHLAHHLAQLLQLFLAHGVQILYHVFQIIDGGIHHVRKIL